MVEVFSVQDGLDAERALLDEVCGGAREHGLLLWQPCDRALVMPRRMERLEGFAPASAAVAERGWPVLLRDTGGEPVPQSPGVLNIALSYALGPGDNEQTRIETAYLRLCQPICDWLRERGLDAGVGAVAGSFCDGRYNVTLDGRKLAGTAQRWRRNGAGRPVVLAHA
ncbi:lipoate--protein ligase family protein, partial [Pseudomonas aeruginosa]